MVEGRREGGKRRDRRRQEGRSGGWRELMGPGGGDREFWASGAGGEDMSYNVLNARAQFPGRPSHLDTHVSSLWFGHWVGAL